MQASPRWLGRRTISGVMAEDRGTDRIHYARRIGRALAGPDCGTRPHDIPFPSPPARRSEPAPPDADGARAAQGARVRARRDRDRGRHRPAAGQAHRHHDRPRAVRAQRVGAVAAGRVRRPVHRPRPGVVRQLVPAEPDLAGRAGRTAHDDVRAHAALAVVDVREHAVGHRDLEVRQRGDQRAEPGRRGAQHRRARHAGRDRPARHADLLQLAADAGDAGRRADHRAGAAGLQPPAAPAERREPGDARRDDAHDPGSARGPARGQGVRRRRLRERALPPHQRQAARVRDADAGRVVGGDAGDADRRRHRGRGRDDDRAVAGARDQGHAGRLRHVPRRGAAAAAGPAAPRGAQRPDRADGRGRRERVPDDRPAAGSRDRHARGRARQRPCRVPRRVVPLPRGRGRGAAGLLARREGRRDDRAGRAVRRRQDDA